MARSGGLWRGFEAREAAAIGVGLDLQATNGRTIPWQTWFQGSVCHSNHSLGLLLGILPLCVRACRHTLHLIMTTSWTLTFLVLGKEGKTRGTGACS
jgi:hypothetical protein